VRKQLVCAVVLIAALAVFAVLTGRQRSEAADERGPRLAHNVYFTLKDNSAESKKKLVDACRKHLSKHEGEVFFAAGSRAEDFQREVNDRDFDVSLHIVFKDKAAHDKYHDAPRHKQFIAENKDNWKKVRVFDTYVGK
jgi:hypothetical protein